MCKYFLTFLFFFGQIGVCSAVNIVSCEDQPEIQRFQQLLEKARQCKVHADCIVAPFRGISNAHGYGFGAPINKNQIDFLSKEYKLLPNCSWGICGCLIQNLEAVVCEMNLCTIKAGPFTHSNALNPTPETLRVPGAH